MKTKYLLAAITMGIFTVSSVKAQEKKQDNVKFEKMESNHNVGEQAEASSDTYACSMHPEEKSNKPGECSKCGMKLAKMEMQHEKMDKTYTCSMHPEVTSNQPGDCSKCGMVLIEKKSDMKMEGDHKGHSH